MMRKITPLSLPDIEPGMASDERPHFDEIDPRELLVDEQYQRNLSDRSIALIRKIVAGWDWRAFKPPVVVVADDGVHVVDGQHTAIAAATHPEIASIPIMVIKAETLHERAGAFVKHNRDRIAVTPTQLHFAKVASGDEDAMTIQQVCERSGARVLKGPPSDGRFQIGDTLAVRSLYMLVDRRHALGARQVLGICVRAQMTPISADGLKAVEELMFGPDYKGQVSSSDLELTIREMGRTAEREADRFAAEHDLPRWKGLVVTWFRNTKKVRRGKAA